MVKFIAVLTVNESEGLHEIQETANYQVPSKLEQFDIYEETINLAIKVAIKKLSEIANDSIEISYINEEKGTTTLNFSNCEDGLGLTYEIQEEETTKAVSKEDLTCNN